MNHNYKTEKSTTFALHQRLASDTHPICETRDYYLGINKNAVVPWLILVPKTQEVELFACEPQLRQRIRNTIDSLANFTQHYFTADKINIATLGNVVPQLHIHIIARNTNDCEFPNPIWGTKHYSDYDPKLLRNITLAIQEHLHT